MKNDDKACRAAFEKWRNSNIAPTNNDASVGDWMRRAWQACDQHWRERLQSEEMRKIITQIIGDYPIAGTKSEDELFVKSPIAKGIARAVINAILEGKE